MNNKIKKGLGYFSFFILALGVLPLGNILANEKVEPTKFVIEQNSLEANGFKIANDQVLTSEDVVKLSNVKSVDNLVDVNKLTVSDDQLANVNQVNPNGGLYNLTLTNGQQATITIPVVKEGNLVTANSKGALIFKNLALSQEANNKEKVLEETGVYSVAFNNGYENKDLTVNVKDNKVEIKDTTLGLSKELNLVDSTDPSTSEDKARAAELVGTAPQGLHTQDEMQNAAYNGNVQQATTLGEENYTKTVGSAQRIEVTTEQELTDALNKQTGSNVRVVIMNDITLTGGTKYIKGANTFYTIEGNTPSVTLTLSKNSGYLFTVWANNITVSFKNLNIVGSMADGAALNNGWRNASGNQSIITSGYQGTTFNFYDGFNVKNIRSDGSGIVGRVTTSNSYLNVFGGNYSNLANNTHGVFGMTGNNSRMNMFGGKIEATYSNSVVLLNDYQHQNEQAIYGTVITNNRTGLGFDSGYRGVSEPAAFTQDALTNPKFFVTGQAQVYDNWAVDDKGIKILPANLGSLELNDVVDSNLDKALQYAQRSPIINPMPGGKVSAGAMKWTSNGTTFDTKFDKNMADASKGWSKLGGMPLAEIKYTNPALIEKYQNNGVVEGFDTDFTFTPDQDKTYVLTKRGKYRLVEREYQGRYYAVVVKDYTNLTVKSYLDTDLNNPFDTTSNVVQNNAGSTIPTAVKEGYKAIEAEVVSNSDTNGIQAGTKLNPIYGTEGDQAGKIIGFQLNPNNSTAGIYDIEIKVIYHQDVPEYTVTFDKNKGNGSTEVTEEMDPQKIPVGETTGLTPNKFAREGYTFSGWNTQADGSGTSYTDGQEVTNIAAKGENVVLYAQWTPITYKVIFKSTTATGAGTVTNTMEPQTLTYDKAENLSQNTLINPGYHFTGWSTKSSEEVDTDYADEASVINLASTQGAEVVLYPLWEANTYRVVFEPNPGEGSTAVTGSTASKNMVYSVVTTLTPIGFKREGYTFKNWNTSPDGTGTSYGDRVRVRNLTTENNVDVHLYARWEPITYQIKFNANTGSGSMDNQVLTFDKKANLKTNGFTKENYTFKGWSTTQDGTVEYQNEQEVKNLTSQNDQIINLYAVWEEDPNYNVVYNDNYGDKEDSDPEKAYVNKPYQIKQEQPTRDGYTLLGYNTDKSANEALYTVGQTIPAGIGQKGQTIKLYAIWQANKYEVVFDKNAASATGSMENQEFTYDQQQALTTNSYTNAGYTFKGWATSQNGDVVYTDGQQVSNLTTQANGQVTLYAVWQANKYQVVFDPNTGSGNMDNQEFTYGQEQKLNANQFTKEGYTFKGWNTQANGAGQAYADLASVSNLATEGQVTLYAQWQANNYAVIFDKNAASAIGSMENQEFTYDQQQALITNGYTNAGYTFKGWSTTQDGSVVYTDGQEVSNLTTQANGQVTLYAVWEANKYQVVFDANTGSGNMDNQEFTYGQEQQLKANQFTKEGYTFNGWNTQANGAGQAYADLANVSNLATEGQVTLFAQWQANNYTVKFDANGGQGAMKDQQFAYDQAQKLRANVFTKENYTFAGWATSQNGDVVYTDAKEVKNLTTANNGEVTLYAVWTENDSYNVVYDNNYDSQVPSDPQKVYLGVNYTIKSETPSREGYTFVGWNTDKSATEAQYSPNQEVEGGIGQTKDQTVTLYAIWQTKKYVVIFDKNAASATGNMPNQEWTYDSEFSLNKNSYTNPGYTFKGWAKEPEGEVVYQDGATISDNFGTRARIAGNVTLYAKWEANKYQVVFDSNTGSGNMENQEFTYGQEQQLKANQFTKEGYTFKGWNTQANGAGQAYADLASVSNLATEGQVTLYAQWQANNYTVKFNANGGQGEMKDQQFEYDKAQKLSENAFTKENYTFAGWATSQNGDVVYTDAKEVKNLTTANNGEVTLYAVWTENDSYNVVYDNNYDSQVPSDPQKVYLGVNYTIKSETPSREGYTFVGWNTDKAATEAQYSPNQEVEGGIGQTKDQTVTLYAIWQANKYVVIFDKNAANATGSMPNQEWTYDSEFALNKNTYTNAGYTFKGWATSPDGEVVYTDGQEVTNLTTQANGQVTLYAKWEKQTSVVLPGPDGNLGTKDDVTVKGDPVVSNPDNGSVQLPNGGTVTPGEDGKPIPVPPGTVVAPDGTITLPDKNPDAGFENDNTVQIKPNPDGSITIPGKDHQLGTDKDVTVKPGEGSSIDSNGNIHLPNGGVVTTPEGEIQAPPGSTVLPDGTVIDKDGNILNPDGSITLPGADGEVKPPHENDNIVVKPEAGGNLTTNGNGSVVIPGQGGTVIPDNGTGKPIELPGGSTVDKDGTITLPDKNPEAGFDKDNTVQIKPGPNGSIIIPGKDHQLGTDKDVTVKPGEGSSIDSNGNIHLPNGGVVTTPEGEIQAPPGSTVLPDGTVIDKDGNILNPDGSITLPGADGEVKPPHENDNIVVKPEAGGNLTTNGNGSVVIPGQGGTVIPDNGTGKPIKLPGGSTVDKDGTITLPDKNPEAGFENDNTVQIKPGPNGSIIIPGKDHQLGTDKDVTVKPGEGSSIDSNGNINLPNGGVVTTPEGEIQAPAGSTVLPDGIVIDKNGNILNPDGSITVPGKDDKPGTSDDVTIKPGADGSKPTTNPDGSVNIPNNGGTVDKDGTITLPGEDKKPGTNDDVVVKPENGATVNPDGSVTLPNGGTVIPDNGTGKPIKLPGVSVVGPDGTITLPDKNPEAGFDKDNTVQIKPGPNGSIIIPGKDHQLGTGDDVTVKPGEGSSIDSNGNIHLPNGGVVTTPEGEIQAPPGSTVLPDGTVIDKDGNILNPDGSITHPGADGKPGTGDDIIIKPGTDGSKPTTNPDGSVNIPNGGIVNGDGTITLPGKDGETGTDDDVNIVPNGPAIVNPDGSVTLPNGGTVNIGKDCQIKVEANGVVTPEGIVINPGKNGVVDTKPYNANTRTISAENDDQVLDPAVVCSTSAPSVREDKVSNVKPGNGTNTGAKSIISVLLLVIIASFATLIVRKRK